MSGLLKVFKEFYNEINGATLTGAIDVIVVEQADGSFVCSPFHVRFGKLGVLRSREKIVDIEVNGEPVNIHMKLGESGEAFFVQECPEYDADELPENLATSPLPSEEYTSKFNESNDTDNKNIDVKLRRNSTVLSSSEAEKVYENQQSDYKSRRYSEKVLNRRNTNETKLEYTTEQIRLELGEKEALKTEFKNDEATKYDSWTNATKDATIIEESNVNETDVQIAKKSNVNVNSDQKSHTKDELADGDEQTNVKEPQETKSKKKRRKKSMLKKKASITSNILPTTSRKSSSSSAGSGSNIETDPNQQSSNATSASIEDGIKSDAINPNDSFNEINNVQGMDTPRICDVHFFSDTEVAASPYASRPSTPIQSDSEFEISQREKNADPMTSSTASWKWGEFPITPNKTDVEAVGKDQKQAERNSTLTTMLSFMKETMRKRKSTSDGGVYLSDLMNSDVLDPEIAAKYFPTPKIESFRNDGDDLESGNGTSIPQSPSSIENSISKSIEFVFEHDNKLYDKNVMALSLCGGLENNGPTDEEFERNIIDYADVCQNPSIFVSPLLVVRLCDKYYSWTAACSIVMTAIAYRKPLTNDAIEQLMSANKVSEENTIATKLEEQKADANRRNSSGYSWWKWRRSNETGDKKLPKETECDRVHDIKEMIQDLNKIALNEAETSASTSAIQNIDQTDSNVKHDDSISTEFADVSKTSFSSEKYRKTLRLTSEQIVSLNLKPGMNELEFSVTTAYQGTSRCKCYVFRWKHTDKVVISDIDGTITKSDVLGHILPMVGKDWAQLGVAELFTKIARNGYKLLYLSARAIGQSRATRDYLRSIQQGNVKLPDGPLLLNPTSLISAFHREVIERKPEQFKIACLSDIKALFPENPFYAGYGNRINDVWAYCAVGIPVIRIFTINHKGELKHELNKTFQATYHSMAYIVDQLFPPVNDREESVEFSSFNFWREPVADVNFDHLLDANASANGQGQVPIVQHTPPTPVNENDVSTIPDKL